MGRGYRLWVERDRSKGTVIGCGASPLTARDEAGPGRENWQRWARPYREDRAGVWGPWGLLLRLLNVERAYPPPRNHDLTIDREIAEWHHRNREELPEVDWEAWTAFAGDVKAPYLLARERGHPLLWYPAADGQWYGFLFNFGLIPGRWYWWVPGTERVEFLPDGSRRIIFGQRHEERPAGATMRELFASLPPSLLEVDSRERLTLKEALDEVLRRHAVEERDRCRFFVYRPQDDVGDWDGPLGVATLEAVREWLDGLAWTWLSPYVHFWHFVLRTEWGREFGDDPNCKKEETAERLVRMTPKERFARTVAQAGGDPIAGLLRDLEPEAGVEPGVSPRLLASLIEKARLSVSRRGAGSMPESAWESERQQVSYARQRLAGSARVREEYVTTNVFAAVAKQLQWAVEAGLTLLRCPHPGCGRAFFREPGHRGRYCPEHRSDAARQQRSRQRRKRGGE